MKLAIIKNIVEEIKRYPTIVLSAHKNPDGDALSSSYGLALALQEAFPDKKIFVALNPDEIESRFKFLKVKRHFFINPDFKVRGKYLSIVGDTSVESRIENFDIINNADFKICFDHHTSGADVNFDIFWSEPKYPASSLQAIEIANSLLKKLNQEIAFCLIIGVYTDTYNFRYSLANPMPLSLVSKCLKYVDDKTMQIFFDKMTTRSKEDLKIMNYVTKNIKYLNDFAYVIFKIRETKKYPKNINIGKKVNMIANIEGINKWCFFIEEVGEEYHRTYNAHFRSKHYSLIPVVTKYSGGGHHNAAGCHLNSKKQLKSIIFEIAK